MTTIEASKSAFSEYSVRMKVKTKAGWKFQEVQKMFVRDVPELLKEIYVPGYMPPLADRNMIAPGAFMRKT